ncbi:hypothetical protein RYX53_15860, partial [Alkalibacillus haloalkaliphilus]|nr:hypothetical protein [Alkalibacillus haloalkaliphilus]
QYQQAVEHCAEAERIQVEAAAARERAIKERDEQQRKWREGKEKADAEEQRIAEETEEWEKVREVREKAEKEVEKVAEEAKAVEVAK